VRFNLIKRKVAMIIEHKEDISSDFEGTIIDIETIGEFLNQYHDSRRYKDIKLVIFGTISRYTLNICCARGKEAIKELSEKTEELMELLQRPFYAFNSKFERGVLFYTLGRKIDFEGELQEAYESKAYACKRLGIPNYDDPFYDIGKLCSEAWENGKFKEAIAHNRACLLKERDILLKEGFRESEELNFVK